MRKIRRVLLITVLALPVIAQAQYRPPQPAAQSDKTIQYELVRNEPGNSGLTGIVVNPLILDANKLNLNLAGGVELFYTFKSKWNLCASYRISYFDNPKGEGQKGEPYGTVDSYGTPLSYKKASAFQILGKANLIEWEKDTRYHITLGSAGYRRVAVTRVEGKVLHALTGRVGYMVDNRIIENEDGIAFKTNTPVYNYHYKNQVYPLDPTNLSTSSTMLGSNTIIVGIGYSTYRDIKIDLDDEKYRGRREEKAQTDLFLDLLYAHKLELKDMVYYHALYPFTQEYEHLPQRLDMKATTLSKIGARLGYQVLNMYRPHFGTKFVIETGMRPGPKAETATDNIYFQISIGILFGGRISHEE